MAFLTANLHAGFFGRSFLLFAFSTLRAAGVKPIYQGDERAPCGDAPLA
jgi:hypothetical protein